MYEVSSTGKVKSKKQNKILQIRLTYDGYSVVRLCKNAKHKQFRVNRLVALHFVPNPENKPEVNHEDGNKSNNNDWNLTWKTHAENIKHAFDLGLCKPINEVPVKRYSKNGVFEKEYKSIGEAARDTKTHVSNISLCLAGTRRTTGGYVWKK